MFILFHDERTTGLGLLMHEHDNLLKESINFAHASYDFVFSWMVDEMMKIYDASTSTTMVRWMNYNSQFMHSYAR